MTRVMTASTRKTISLLLTAIMIFSMCSVGIPAAAYIGETSPLIRMATPTDATPTDATPTTPEEQPTIDIPKYYYNDSDDIEKLPTDYINGIMIAHYFNIMGAYDGENNFKPNLPMKSSDFEYALKAINGNEPEMTNFEGELLTVQALVLRIWLAAGKGSYIYSAEMQQSYLSTYNLGISYNAENDLANAWTFCVKNGIVSQFLKKSDFSVNLPVTRAMAAYALSNYHLWRNGYDINSLSLDIPGVAPIDEAEMRKEATATDAQGNECYIKQAYNIGEYEENDNEKYDEILVNMNNEFVVYTVEMGEVLFTVGTVLIRLDEFGRVSHHPMPIKQAPKNNNLTTTIYFDLNGDGKFDDYSATAIEIKPQTQAGDLNETGDLDSADCLIIQKYLTGSIMLDSAKLNIADINEDGEVNLLDAYTVYIAANNTTAAKFSARENTKKAVSGTSSTTFKFMTDGEEILSPITLNANTHYLKLPKNIYEKGGYSFNYWTLYRLDENGNKLYYCENTDGTGVQWLQNETDEYSKIKFADDCFIYNVPTGEFNELYFEANWISYEDFEYTVLDNGTAEINKYKGNDSYVTVPNIIDGNNITSIGKFVFEKCTDIKEIIILDGITSVGYESFIACTNLISVTISEGLTSIGERAFYNCTVLKNITIPKSTTSIGSTAFYNCTSFTSITIPDSVTSIGNGAFDNTAWYNNQPDGDVYINNIYYSYKGKMPENTIITMKKGTKAIADYSFYDCKSLTSINIPNSVTSIGDWAFCNCTSLTSINIPDTVTSIGHSAFYGCTSLTSITIPDTVTSIGGFAFFGCGLNSVQLPKNFNVFATTAFYYTPYYNNITGAFRCFLNDDDTLRIQGYDGDSTELIIPSKIMNYDVTSILHDAFYLGCKTAKNITSIDIPDSVTSIGDSAFAECISLTSVIFSENSKLRSIGDCAFALCEILTSITIPEGVTSIGGGAFYGCSSLTDVVLPSGFNTLKSTAFYYTPWYRALVGEYNILLKDDNTLEISGYNGTDTTIIIPYEIKGYSVTSIGWGTFEDCTSLTSIAIPEGVTSIEEAAFEDCTSLTNITIPNSVTSIDGDAFYDCPNLTISCYANSYAQTYAIKNNIPYTLITETP